MSIIIPYIYKQKTILLQEFKIFYRKEQPSADRFAFELPVDVKNALQSALKTNFVECRDFSRPNHVGSNFIPAATVAKELESVYLCTIVESQHASLVLVNMFASFGVKLWLNDKCLLIQSDFGGPMFNIKARLKKGYNVFLVEAHRRFSTDFQLSLIPYSEKERKRAASFLRLPFEHNLPVFVHENDYALGCHQTTILFVSGGVQEYLPQVEIALIDSQSGEKRTSLVATINEPLTITLSPTLPQVKYRHVCLEYTFSHVNGKRITQTYQMTLADDAEGQESLKREVLKLAASTEIRTKDALLGNLFYTEFLRSNPHKHYLACKEIRDLLIQIQSGSYFPENLYSKGNQHVWIPSELDGRYVGVRVRIPENYDPSTKKYPSVIYIGLAEFSDYSTMAPIAELPEECLFFDVSERGMTCGSYVGEAAFMEMRNWILQHFAVDPTRIYLCGYSAGAYAAWVLASTHPHLFAGIYTIGGIPDFRLTCNLNNLTVQTLASEEDFVLRNKNKKIRKAFTQHRYFKQYSVPMTLHRKMGQYYCHPDPLSNLLSHKGITEPTEIHFRTDRNRHRQSYWMTIHGVKEIGKYAEVKAAVLSEKEIHVQAVNITGLTLQIPSMIDRDDFCVTINGTTIACENILDSHLHFTYIENRRWKQIEKEPDVPLRHGTGLLDIYLGPMSIILPENAEEDILNAARGWAAPTLSAVTPQVYTNYPIVSVTSLSESTLQRNLLCFDVAGTNPLCQQLSLPVNCDRDGYTYLGERVNGDYLVFQCTDNTYHPEHSVTVISTNNISFLKKNFFTRRLILPSYIGGLHPYLNREILIWDGRRFWGTYTNGNTLEEVL